MKTIAVIFTTFFAAVVYGAVALIQMGGWLPVTAAILSVMHFFISTSLLVILIAGEWAEKKKKKEEASSNEN